MAQASKRERIALAWAEYRADALRLRDLEWTDYLAADDRIWRRYLSTERSITAEAEPKAA